MQISQKGYRAKTRNNFMKVKIIKLLHHKINTTYGEKTQVRIWTDQHSDRMLSGFMTKEMDGWKVGDEVDIEIEDTGKYLNFKVPNKSNQKTNEDLKKICDYIRIVEKRVLKIEQQLGIDKVKEVFGREEITEEDAPF